MVIERLAHSTNYGGNEDRPDPDLNRPDPDLNQWWLICGRPGRWSLQLYQRLS